MRTTISMGSSRHRCRWSLASGAPYSQPNSRRMWWIEISISVGDSSTIASACKRVSFATFASLLPSHFLWDSHLGSGMAILTSRCHFLISSPYNVYFDVSDHCPLAKFTYCYNSQITSSQMEWASFRTILSIFMHSGSLWIHTIIRNHAH